MIGEDDVVLDVGGWAKPLRRADWVVDRMPHATRGLYGFDGDGAERFTRTTWIERDLCAREALPFGDKSIDFAVCSHTLEDIRDPVWVCQELNRVAKAGYIETPSRLEEQSYGIQGPWVGWGHHHWLVDMGAGGVEFVFKHHVVNREGSYFPAAFWHQLSPEDRVSTLWWEDSFDARERFFTEPNSLDGYLEHFVSNQLASRGWPTTAPARSRLARVLRR